MKKRAVAAFDVETTANVTIGPRPYSGRDRIFSWAICDEEGRASVYRLDNVQQIDLRLQAFLSDTTVEKVCHNLKFELTMLAVCGYKVPQQTVWHDTMILSQLTNNLRPSHALDYVAWELCGWPRELDARIAHLARVYGGYHRIEHAIMHEYQVTDVQRTMLLFRTLYPDIERNPLLLEDYRNEIALIDVTRREEARGMMLDREETERLIADTEMHVSITEQKLEQLLGEHINLRSSTQIAALLFKRLRMTPIRYTAAGVPSTDERVLRELQKQYAHPILELIIQHRAYAHALGILHGYLRMADGSDTIHPNIKTNHAGTGREACDSPNLQNVQVAGRTPYSIPARRCFRARPGHVLISMDEAGIELRMILERSQCKRMINELVAGVNPHETFCRIMYGTRFTNKSTSRELYDMGKNAHFALCYGAALPKIAATLGISESEAAPGYKEYCRLYPENAYLVKTGLREVERSGVVVTPFGRTLRVPAQERYAWLNYVSQGTAAGIIKRAQVAMDKQFAGRPVWLLFPVHDEVVVEADRCMLRELPALLRVMHVAMTEIPHIQIPLDTEAKLSVRLWGAAKEISCQY